MKNLLKPFTFAYSNVQVKIPLGASISSEWLHVLDPLIKSKYFNDLMIYVNEQYAIKKESIFPKNSGFLFGGLNKVKPEDVKVVIIGSEPITENSNNLLFGRTDGVKSELHKMQELEISKICGGDVDIDPSLNSWSSQGVLMLNANLLGYKPAVNSFAGVFNYLTSNVISYLNEYNPNIVYVAMSNSSLRILEKYVSHKENIIEINANYRIVGTSNLTLYGQINKQLLEQNERPIKWSNYSGD